MESRSTRFAAHLGNGDAIAAIARHHWTVIARSETTKRSRILAARLDCFSRRSSQLRRNNRYSGRREAAIRNLEIPGSLVALAPRNDTPRTYLRLTRDTMRPSFSIVLALECRERGECRVRGPHPWPRVRKQKVHEHYSPQVAPISPAFPARLVLTGSFVLSPGIGLSCPRRPRIITRRLGASVEASGPHDFTVRNIVVRLSTSVASTASHAQRLVTIAKRLS